MSSRKELNMEELKICYKKINNLMKEIENRHDVSIDDFINLDDDLKSEYMGDWTEQDVECWKYLADRAAIIQKAYNIVKEEMHLHN